ncbi:hypothetical protein PoB_007528800 [Plakobranchus ocellatus]|uniref:Uncharacterized protein n=1 Tax=Plakobranchus ocellatus TaxID=259542 RepID=A0AAV4DWZ5_9GAST|nr:hypothetical protein PoB_007528800 [Plakobranchus ocellatus]
MSIGIFILRGLVKIPFMSTGIFIFRGLVIIPFMSTGIFILRGLIITPAMSMRILLVNNYASSSYGDIRGIFYLYWRGIFVDDCQMEFK